jgi:hypothetical protein
MWNEVALTLALAPPTTVFGMGSVCQARQARQAIHHATDSSFADRA